MELELATIDDIFEELDKRAGLAAFLFFVPDRGLVAGEKMTSDDYLRASKVISFAHLTSMAEYLRQALLDNEEHRRRLADELGFDFGGDRDE